MLHKGAEIRRPVYQWNTQLTEKKKESVIYFTLVVVCYYLICFKYATLCNILHKYAAGKQKRF